MENWKIFCLWYAHLKSKQFFFKDFNSLGFLTQKTETKPKQKQNQPTRQLRCFNLKSVKNKSFHILYSLIICLVIRWFCYLLSVIPFFSCHLVYILSPFSSPIIILLSFAIVFYLFSLLPGFSSVFISIYSFLMIIFLAFESCIANQLFCFLPLFFLVSIISFFFICLTNT